MVLKCKKLSFHILGLKGIIQKDEILYVKGLNKVKCQKAHICMFRDLWESNAEWCNLICKGQKGVKCKKRCDFICKGQKVVVDLIDSL